MSDKQIIPDIKKVKERAAKIEEICKRADANILILDDIIAQLDEDIRSSLLYQYRLKRAKQLLSS
jgi:recombinational DNA repair ATPase RecF